MKQTLKLLFLNPGNIIDFDQLTKSIEKLPIIIVLENNSKSYIVDTGIRVEKK